MDQLEEEKFLNEIDIINLVSDVDQNGVPWEWKALCEQLEVEGVAAIGSLFDYYQEHNDFFDPWVNYLVACSYFSDEELGLPKNRNACKRLLAKVKKLMKKLPAEEQHLSTNVFLKKYKKYL